jgi:hypothetical protein
MTAKRSELSVRYGMLVSNNGSFIDYEERLLLDEIPNTDFSKGGVYFFGASTMKWAFTTWDLPDGLRQRLGNFGMGAASHQTTLRLIRYLGQRGLLSNGVRNEVIIGVSFHLGTTETPQSYFPMLLRRQNLYAIDADDRLIDAPVPAVQRWWLIEKARSGGFVWNAGRLVVNGIKARLHRSRQVPHDPVVYRRGWYEFMGPDWQRNIDRELGRLHETLSLLQASGVPVKVILLPQGTWMDELPFPSYYDTRVRNLCRSTSTPLLDWSKSLPDSDFFDSNHLNNAGQAKFRAMILREEAGFLRSLDVRSKYR